MFVSSGMSLCWRRPGSHSGNWLLAMKNDSEARAVCGVGDGSL